MDFCAVAPARMSSLSSRRSLEEVRWWQYGIQNTSVVVHGSQYQYSLPSCKKRVMAPHKHQAEFFNAHLFPNYPYAPHISAEIM